MNVAEFGFTPFLSLAYKTLLALLQANNKATTSAVSTARCLFKDAFLANLSM